MAANLASVKKNRSMKNQCLKHFVLLGKKYSMKPLDVLNILLLLIVGNCNCIYLQKNRHLKGTNEKKKKTEMENTQNRALKYKVQGTK